MTSIKSDSTISTADAKDIQELNHKIALVSEGKMNDERFRHYRLTRGVYGQRQLGVQMFRTKLPAGRVNAHQLEVMADIAENYGHNNLHITTRQNIQFHFVKLANAPKVWTGLAEAGLTARGACGNTVRNITSSAAAGVDPEEPFDVTPYLQATFEYFLRNAVGQDMGRKIKIAFSSSEKDSGYTYFHDFGFIAKQKEIDGKIVNGFKVVIGGGLGAQSYVAPVVDEFLPATDIIPFINAGLRVFDRYGERSKRHKARMKFLVKDLGAEDFMIKLREELKAVPVYKIEITEEPSASSPDVSLPAVTVDKAAFELWRSSNVFEQKQKGAFGVYLKIHLGDVSPNTARALAKLIRETAADDVRFTPEQNILLRFVKEDSLQYLYSELLKLDLADAGHQSIADVTACPGTDTCVLGVTNSTGLATELKNILTVEYPDLLDVEDVHIKISGCMNSCGQHMSASIGFHGSSIKKGPKVIPAMQVVLGGGLDLATGEGFVADKIIKLPSKRIPEAVRTLIKDYQDNGGQDKSYLHYYLRIGEKKYFYDMLKYLGDIDGINELEFFDWGQDKQYIQEIGVGECAGVSYDMVGSILGDAVEKLEEAKAAIARKEWSEGIYHSYTGMVIGAKGWLLSKDVKCNTHIGIIDDFETHFSADPEFAIERPFSDLVLQMRDHEPEAEFAQSYLETAIDFVQQIIKTREAISYDMEKLVLDSYYKA